MNVAKLIREYTEEEEEEEEEEQEEEDENEDKEGCERGLGKLWIPGKLAPTKIVWRVGEGIVCVFVCVCV